MKNVIVSWRPFWKSKEIRMLVMQEQEKEMKVDPISYGMVQCLALMQRGGA